MSGQDSAVTEWNIRHGFRNLSYAASQIAASNVLISPFGTKQTSADARGWSAYEA